MQLLVTGGTGFIGSHVVPALETAGHRCVRLDLHPPLGGGPWVRGDVRDPATLRHAIQGCEAVLHLAAAHHDFGLAVDTYRTVNVEGTRAVLDAMNAAGVRRIAFTSTAAVYGATPGVRTEATPPAPSTPYGATKLEAEQLLVAWAAADPRREVLIIRPTVVFGPGNYANMFTLIRQVARGRFLPVGRGANQKSLAYVGNLLAALAERWPAPAAPGVRLYNYADVPDLTSTEIAAAVYRGLGRTPPGWSIPMRLARLLALPFDLATALTGRDLGVSTARLRKFAEAETRLYPAALEAEGFRPPTPLPEGIAAMVRWYRAVAGNPVPPPRLPPAEVVPWPAP